MEQKAPNGEFYKIVSILFLIIIFLLILIAYLSNVFDDNSQSHVTNHKKEINEWSV